MNFENPFTKGFEAWSKMAEESWNRTTAIFAEIDKLEAKGVERADSAITEMAKLTKESIGYSVQLGHELRKLTLDAMQRSAGAFTKAVTPTT